MNENINKLEKLSNLYDKGAINKEEFQSMKNDVLKKTNKDIEKGGDKPSKKKVLSKIPPSPYIISSEKMIVLHILTLGMYDLFWYYQQLKFFKEKEENQIQVIGTTIFYPVIAQKLFDKMHNVYIEQEKKVSLSPRFVAGIAFAVNAFKYLSEDIFISLLFTFLTIIPPIIMQKRMNKYWKKKLGQKFTATKFTFLNWLTLMAIAVGIEIIINFFLS